MRAFPSEGQHVRGQVGADDHALQSDGRGCRETRLPVATTHVQHPGAGLDASQLDERRAHQPPGLIRLEHVVPTAPAAGRALPLGALLFLEFGRIEWIDSYGSQCTRADGPPFETLSP